MQSFKTPPGMCPNCGHLIDAASSMDGFHRRPNNGDFSICLYCASILRFEDAGSLALAEEKDFEGAPPDFVEALADAQKAAKMHLALQGRSEQAKPKRPN